MRKIMGQYFRSKVDQRHKNEFLIMSLFYIHGFYTWKQSKLALIPKKSLLGFIKQLRHNEKLRKSLIEL